MEALRIIIQGLVNGITEFLPVSNNGHMAIFRNVLGFGDVTSRLFDTLLMIAAIAVIIVGFKKDLLKTLKGFIADVLVALNNIVVFFGNLFSQEKEEYIEISGSYKRLAAMVFVATISSSVTGICTRNFALFASHTTVIPAIFFVVTGVLLFLTIGREKGTVNIKEASYFSAFIVGTVIGLSVLPGLSRCGLAIAVCILFNYEYKLTFRFVFLTMLPALLLQVIINIFHMANYGISDAGKMGWYILATFLSFITGYVGLVIVKKTIKKGNFIVFSIYCLVAGAFSFASILIFK